MQALRKQNQKPWLTSKGVAIPTQDLKEIVKTWDLQTWEAYLKWYDRPCREKLVTSEAYSEISDRQDQTIFEQFDQSVTPAKHHLCERLLAKLPEHQSAILRLYFLEGLSDAKISAIVKRSRSNVGYHKNQALKVLKQGNSGNIWVICQFMREGKVQAPTKIERYWDHVTEVKFLKNSSFREALQGLSAQARAVIYLHYFRRISVGQVARLLSAGFNVVQMLETAAISKLKRNYIYFETGSRPGEGALC